MSKVTELANRCLEQYLPSFMQMIALNNNAGQIVDQHSIAAFDRFASDLDAEIDPERAMVDIQLSLLRAYVLLTRREDIKDLVPRENMILTSAPDLSHWMYKPYITRRIDQEVSPEVCRFLQKSSSQPMMMDVYCEETLELFLKSDLAKTEPWVDLMPRFVEQFADPAFKAGIYYLLHNLLCYRARSMVNAKSTGHLQGTALAKAISRSGEAHEVIDMDPMINLTRKSCGVDHKNWKDILTPSNPFDVYSIEAVHTAMHYKEIDETGKSRALIGVDEVASLATLAALDCGSRQAAKDTNLFSTFGVPWKGTPKDIWRPVVHQYSLMDVEARGLDPNKADTFKAMRKFVKSGGTPWGFGAQAKTISYGLCGLDRAVDEERLGVPDKIELVHEKLSHPEIFLDKIGEDWDMEETLKYYGTRAKHLVRALGTQLKWLSDWNSESSYLVKEANRQGVELPVVTTPDGHEAHVKKWRVNRKKPRKLFLTVNGVKVEQSVPRYEVNDCPNYTTVRAHTGEGYIARETCNTSWNTNPQYDVHQVFDAFYTHPNNLDTVSRAVGRSAKKYLAYQEATGFPLDALKLALGEEVQPREFSSADISDDVCIVDA